MTNETLYWLALAAALLGGYLLGSLSFAVVTSRAFGLADPRSYGSGNPGATNVLRSGHKAAALVTLLGDAAKGAVAVALVRWLGPAYGLGEGAAAWAGAAALVGHLFPVFFGFKGGKGVATFFGAIFVIDGWVGLAAGLTWLLVAWLSRYSSAASLAAALAAVAAQAVVGGPGAVFGAIVLMALLQFVRHRQNIANLLAGRERRLGAKAAAPKADGGAGS